jgi:hypothetical protein
VALGRNSVRHAWVPLGKLKPYGNHARKHNRQQRRKIRRLLEQLGTQPVPVLCSPEFAIIDGHALWAELRELGVAEVFVAIVQNQSAAEINALRLSINRIPLDARWDQARPRATTTELGRTGHSTKTRRCIVRFSALAP